MTTGCLQRQPQLLPHASMMFLCIINFDILRNLKESLLVTRMGAEIIPFIKLWVVMPAAFVFVFTYSFLANRLNKKHLFLLTMLPFMIWMPVFSFYLYPNLQVLAPVELCHRLSAYLPESLMLMCGLLEHWPLTILFTSAELWSSGVLCTLFWTTVNDTSTIESSSKEYPWLALIGNSASLFSGPMILFLVQHFEVLGQNGWETSLYALAIIFVICGLGMIFFYYYSVRLAQAEFPNLKAGPDQQAATSLPLWESFAYLARSPYLRNIALIMLGYCVAINMVEVAWKSQLVRLYTTEIQYSVFMGHLTFYNGIGSILMALTAIFLMRFGWRSTAMATPLLMTLTGTPFFLMILLSKESPVANSMATPLFMAGLFIGTICNVASKSAKYTLFDATKEMAFVPLDNEQKLKGKASIELIVSRVGKSSSAMVQQGLIIFFGSLTASMHWLAGIFLVIAIIWLTSVNRLSRQYNHFKRGGE